MARVLLSMRDARRVQAERKFAHRFPQHRVAPARLDVVPIQTRAPAPELGFDALGRAKVATTIECYVTILDVTPSTLQEATDADARREGYKSAAELLGAFMGMYGEPADPQPVWLLEWEVSREVAPRFLSQRVVAGSQGDYVASPARALGDEPEAVDEFVQAELVRVAHARDHARRRDRAALVASMPLDEQIEWLAEEAHRRHVDVRDALRQARRYRHRPGVAERHVAAARQRLVA
jgi:hypothetical protein